eukprot:CAMPEP_0180343418 /NCGR_PEP_ID=MMETSP0989-20121125/2275_1 /TAXON_ID=697907 /ORGANISM="non described non described, Strain CCMP2293" /LENGTH=69 /DNA_ID=CAMNT_0022332373 /DNA_START=108 /DNA_END=317 /DNA_ORIENTATION=+
MPQRTTVSAARSASVASSSRAVRRLLVPLAAPSAASICEAASSTAPAEPESSWVCSPVLRLLMSVSVSA